MFDLVKSRKVLYIIFSLLTEAYNLKAKDTQVLGHEKKLIMTIYVIIYQHMLLSIRDLLQDLSFLNITTV